jgi:hypothetical protein
MATTVTTTNLETNRNSSTGGVIMITIANPAVDKQYGTSTPCRSCLVQQFSGTQAYMNIDAAATTSTWKLSSTSAIPVPVDDINKLHFIGTAGDIIQILYRN